MIARQAAASFSDGAEPNSSADSRYCDDETKAEPDLLAEDVGVHDTFLESLTMVLLTLGHFDDSVGSSGHDFVVPLENLGWGKRTRESSRNLRCDSHQSGIFLVLFFGTHRMMVFISPVWRTARIVGHPSFRERRTIRKPLLHIECPVQPHASRLARLYSQPQRH